MTLNLLMRNNAHHVPEEAATTASTATDDTKAEMMIGVRKSVINMLRQLSGFSKHDTIRSVLH